METCCPVVELRQYTLHPGKRDVLIRMFEHVFYEAQEVLGMKLPGVFRDLDHPDRFVWLRGFGDMEARRAALTAFYDGPVWKANRDAANATMIDSDNVLLLRPVRPETGFRFDGPPVGVIVVTIWSFRAPPGPEALAALERELRHSRALFQTEPAENTFPRLPVRAGENVVVSFGTAEEKTTGLPASQLLRLEPTGRSRLR